MMLLIMILLIACIVALVTVGPALLESGTSRKRIDHNWKPYILVGRNVEVYLRHRDTSPSEFERFKGSCVGTVSITDPDYDEKFAELLSEAETKAIGLNMADQRVKQLGR